MFVILISIDTTAVAVTLDEALSRFVPGELPNSSYRHSFHGRSDVLSGLADVAISNFVGRTSSQHDSHTFILVPGGSGIGKTRLGFELTRLPLDVVQAQQGYADLPQVEQQRLTSALQSPLYIFLDLNNGNAFCKPIDTHEASVRLGARVASRCLIGSDLSTVSEIDPSLISAFSTPAVFRRLIDAKLAELDPESVLAIVIHIDEYQFYIDKASRKLKLSLADARDHFKELLDKIGWLMREAWENWNLSGRFFFIPVCTGTSAIDVHYLRTEYRQHVVRLSPLSREDALQMCAGRYDSDPLWPQVSLQNHFLVALGDTGTLLFFTFSYDLFF